MGLKRLATDLAGGLKEYPNHNTPSTSGGFNYGGSTSIFDSKQFNQRSLKYDRGLGSQHQDNPTPFVVTDLPGVEDERAHRGPLSGLFNNPIGNFINGVSDGFVRGGLQFAARRSIEDTKRIGKFFISANGLGFVANQVALQRSNPIIQENAGDGAISQVADFLQGAIGTDLGLGNINRTYLPTNTLAQIPLSSTGKHLDRAGLLPFRPEKGKYQFVAKEGGDNLGDSAYDSKGNRLLFLGKQLGLIDSYQDGRENQDFPANAGPFGPTGDENSGGPLKKIGGFITKAKNVFSGGMDKIKSALGLPSSADLPPILYEYPGGPGSLYGIGDTTIRQYTNTSKPIDPFTGQVKTFNRLKSSMAYYKPARRGQYFNKDAYIPGPEKKEKSDQAQGDILKKGDFNVGSPRYKPKNYGDIGNTYRKAYIRKFDQGKDSKHTFGANMRREQRFRTGNPGEYHHFWKDDGTIDVTMMDINNAIDMVNASDIFLSGEGTSNSLDHSEIKDMIRFHIEAINTDNPNRAETMVFRAFLDDWSDDYTGNWNTIKYNGRGEEFYTYDGFQRKVSFSFKIAAQTRAELKPLYRKLNYLVSQTAPDYKNMRMRGNYVKISIGDLMDRTPGIITSVGLKWQKDYPWEIANEAGDTEMLQLPHVLDVSVSFTPIHSFVPQKGKRDANGELIELSPFILPSDINGSEHIDSRRDWTKQGALSSGFTNTDIIEGLKRAEVDPTGISQGENNIPQTDDAAAASEIQASNSQNANSIPIPPGVIDDQNTNPQQDPAGNPTGDVDSSSEAAAQQVQQSNANASSQPTPNTDEDKWSSGWYAADPDPRFPDNASWDEWWGKTRNNPKGHFYPYPPPIYKTDYSTVSDPTSGGTPPIMRAKVTFDDGETNYIYACGSEQQDPKYGHISVEWLWDVEGSVGGAQFNGKPSEFLIRATVISKGMLFTDNVDYGVVRQLSEDYGSDYEDFHNTGNPRLYPADWENLSTLATKLMKLAEEEGIKSQGPGYKIEAA